MWADPGEAKAFWEQFKDSPLFAKWSEFESLIPYHILKDTFPAGHVIFRSGEPPYYLYLVGSGKVHQSVPDTRDPWLRIEHGPGSFLGQQALFAGPHRSAAVVSEEATVYRINAADLRAAMQRNPDLRDALLHENRASRLRRIPLFSGLEDDKVQWLAQVIEDLSYEANQKLPLAEKNGLWVVDWGQVAITGPASFSFDAARKDAANAGWRLTAGNFFLTEDSLVGRNCIATTATTCFKTRFLYLPADHTKRLFTAIPAVSNMVLRPLDITTVLRDVAAAEAEARRLQPLLSSPAMKPEHLQHLAQFCAWEFVPVGQNITTQGNLGHSFVILRNGMAVIRALDENGRLRPQSTMRALASYGETSLLQGKTRDATVRAVLAGGRTQRTGPGGAEVIILDRRDLQCAFDERPDLWQKGLPLVDRYERVKHEVHRFEWQEEGETVVWDGRRHWLWLAAPLLAVAAVYLLTLLILGRIVDSREALVTSALIVAGLCALIGIVFVTNYLNDYYAVTTYRVATRHRMLFFSEARDLIPVRMIQDVTSQVDFFGALFDFGNVSIRSAAKSDATVFADVPQPDQVRQHIMDVKGEAAVAQTGLGKESLRRGLMSELRLDVMIPERVRPLGPDAPSSDQATRGRGPRALPTSRIWPAAWYVRMVQGFPPRLRRALLPRPPTPPRTVSAQTYVWRKHWLRLVRRAGLPALGVLLLLVLFALLTANGIWQSGLGPVSPATIFVIWLFAFSAALFKLWYEWKDWYNDQYVLTEDAIIDITRKPLAMDAVQRQGNLDRVQTVDARQPTFWSNVFDYGDVIIRTAAADTGYDFEFVAHPKLVQSIIFQRMGESRRRQEEREMTKRQREIVEGLEVYHQLQQDKQA